MGDRIVGDEADRSAFNLSALGTSQRVKLTGESGDLMQFYVSIRLELSFQSFQWVSCDVETWSGANDLERV